MLLFSAAAGAEEAIGTQGSRSSYAATAAGARVHTRLKLPSGGPSQAVPTPLSQGEAAKPPALPGATLGFDDPEADPELPEDPDELNPSQPWT